MLDKKQQKMVISLILVAAISALILATTDRFTRGPIAEAERLSLMRSLMQVLPEHSNNPTTEQIVSAGKSYFIARNSKDEVIALAWKQVAKNGYAGSIHILIGVDVDGKIIAIRITHHRETPGLGDGIVNNNEWLSLFSKQTLESRHWAVKKDGGDFDQFTGATITPRAVVQAVQLGLQEFSRQRPIILQQAATSLNQPQGKKQ